jgi:hypothetical protein
VPTAPGHVPCFFFFSFFSFYLSFSFQASTSGCRKACSTCSTDKTWQQQGVAATAVSDNVQFKALAAGAALQAVAMTAPVPSRPLPGASSVEGSFRSASLKAPPFASAAALPLL